MTQGKPLGLLTAFAVPLMLGSVCQQLYTVADSAVVGRLIGVDAFAAVGAAGFLGFMVLDIILGFTQGFGILFAQRFGGKDLDGLRRSVSMSVLLALGLGLLLTAGSLLAVDPVLRLMGTPADILPDTLVYLRWLFAGTLVTMAYNLAGTLLRALGNSKTPLVAVILSSVLNVALDVLFVAVFHWGVAGVAAATVTAQFFSFLYCLRKLFSTPEARVGPRDFIPDGGTLKELLRLGLPLGFRNAVITGGGLFVQSAINRYGKLFVAGTTAAQKYFGFMQLAVGALDGAFATYSAQNYGAGNLPRIQEGMRCARRMALISSVAISGLIVLLGKPLIALLVTGSPQDMAEILEVGWQNLLVIACGLPLLCLLYLYRSGLQGMGSTLVPMLSGFVELGLRIASVLLLPLLIGRWGVYTADALGWVGAALLLCISYYRTYRKHCRERAADASR